ncbi:hypothetical protein [Aureimonas sp. AU22]|jgi:hypothetical protein|uniref:hypothetical protein n=1 Tax=Aureimonas sp. AU22 TaxID=1638162 RepID=UPI000780BF6C|nr:hypothetical protein [Aureimonas sp. AU22]
MRLVLVALVLSGVAGSAVAQEWRSTGKGEGGAAFFSRDGRPAGARITCLPGGRIAITAAGNGARFPADRPVTLVISVDGMGFSGEARVEPEGPGGGSRFVRVVESGETAAILAALKRGKSVEVSSPAGFMRLPLRGSGKAISALAPVCASP